MLLRGFTENYKHDDTLAGYCCTMACELAIDIKAPTQY